MSVQHRLHVGSRTKQLGVDVEFVGHCIPAVHLAVAIEIHDADVVGNGKQQPTILGAAAPQQYAALVEPNADVTEHVGRQTLVGQDPARGRDRRLQIAHAIAGAGFSAAANTSDLMVTGTVLDGCRTRPRST